VSDRNSSNVAGFGSPEDDVLRAADGTSKFAGFVVDVENDLATDVFGSQIVIANDSPYVGEYTRGHGLPPEVLIEASLSWGPCPFFSSLKSKSIQFPDEPQKRLQEGLAHHLSRISDISVPVVNGDTKATSVKHPEVTRLGLINEWSSRPGFGVCVLSPIAAGAGLNIVAANHVIHLERHWNPAKEDQATDRAYRIGQIRTVTVYLPIGVHPTLESFDSVLNRLLEKKRGLQSVLGLVPPDPVSAPDLMGAIFGSDRRGPFQEKPLDLPAALRLSWRLFESLVAVIYERDAKRVILTPGGSDHGCDVVVLGWGQAQENLLIQCKSTRHDELDSEYAVREVEGARPYYENSLNVIFHRRCLHTTAATFSRRTRQGGDLCKVTMLGRPWLTDALLNQPVTLDEVLRRDCARESI